MLFTVPTSPETLLRLITTFGLAAAAIMFAACGSPAEAERAFWVDPPPAVANPTGGELADLLASDPATGVKSIPLAVLSAAVYRIGDGHPNTSAKAWNDLVDAITPVRDALLKNGWTIQLVSRVDSTGSAAANARVAEARARLSAAALADAIPFPIDRFRVIPGTVAGSGAAARRVEVTLIRNPTNKESKTS